MEFSESSLLVCGCHVDGREDALSHHGVPGFSDPHSMEQLLCLMESRRNALQFYQRISGTVANFKALASTCEAKYPHYICGGKH